MYKRSINYAGISFCFGALLIILSCSRKSDLKINESIHCDLEAVTDDSSFFISSSHPDKYFTGAEKISNTLSRSGQKAIRLNKSQSYGLNYDIKNTRPDEYYVVSVWRKGPGSKGYLAVSDDYSKAFYRAINISDSTDPEGWEKLTLSFYVPPHISNEDMKVYVWNPDDDDVYFDDISITRPEGETYPTYKGISSLNLFVDTVQVVKLNDKRKEAFRKGILETEDDDWVEGILFMEEQMYQADLRLKGDWLDHLLGKKWSFRIKLNKKQTWNGIRTFSVQNPQTRDFINEWLLHRFCKAEDILATRYGFIPLNFNGHSRGLFAWEEHFEKNLIESNNRREGPIVKLNEDSFWKVIQLNKAQKQEHILPVIHSAEIMPFKMKRTSGDPALFQQYVIAQDLYFQYKYATKPVSSIFDVEKLAKYMAMIDLFRTYHGITWHNQRFYYNPVLSKLEPIVFDNFSEKGPVRYVATSIVGNYYIDVVQTNESNLMLTNIFRDTSFAGAYIKYLRKYSDTIFLLEMMGEASTEIFYYDSLITIEYPDYVYDPNYVFVNAKKIRDELPSFESKVKTLHTMPPPALKNQEPEFGQYDSKELPPHFVKAYTEIRGDSSNTVRVENYYSKDIIILGTSKNAKRIRNYIHPEIKVNAISSLDYGHASFDSDTLSNFLYFMVDGDMTTFMVPIRPWRDPGFESPLQEMLAEFAENYKKYFYVDKEDLLILRDGPQEISEPVIIPKGYRVVIGEGSLINIINNAPFISYSTVIIKGTAGNPVIIKSSDGTANGFTVLQAPQRSLVQHAIFDRLNTLDTDGWTLTGAVTFYESDVNFYYTSFQNNFCEDGLNIIRSDFHIEECRITNTFADALDVDFGNGIISKTEFSYLNNDAIDVSGSNIVILDCRIMNSNDKGISGGENSVVSIGNTSISGAVTGIASKDLSRLTINDCEINDCRYGLIAFRKKPEFGPGNIEATALKMTDVTIPYLIEEGSGCIVDGSVIKDDKKDVADIFY
ncbi:MAG: right-handed parallel beta-helix repeat-containing protein [Bacteroidales bacterium]|nr:right-handed parallel beta-helix repeat-containing protein [Bacteroidales bacterium]